MQTLLLKTAPVCGKVTTPSGKGTVKFCTEPILEGCEGAIAHGCNCEGWMHRGLADSVRRAYPDLYRKYAKFCKEKMFQPGNAIVYYALDGKVIFNLATQQTRFSGARKEFIRKSLEKVLSLQISDTIAIPKIGCTHGKLNWEADVLPIIEQLASAYSVNFIVYEP